MPDEINTRSELSAYRYEKAALMLTAAGTAFDSGDLVTANNRAYYCLFHAIRAVLALEAVDFKKHSQVIGYFNKNYIATGLFDRSYGSKFSRAFTIRNHSDYDDFYILSREETTVLMEDASGFLNDVRTFLIGRDIPLN